MPRAVAVSLSLLTLVALLVGGRGLPAENAPPGPAALYERGREQRELGIKELAQADAEPKEAAAHRDAARRHFEEAAQQFAAAQVKSLPHNLEWSACVRCAQAEALLRAGKPADAQAAVAPLLKDSLLSRSHYRGFALYYHGVATFALKDYVTAGRSLSLLTPFSDPAYGTHARYLLARVHHLTDERPEAATHYAGVLADYEHLKKQAAEALEQPERFKDDPTEKTRLEALRDGPPPNHVARAAFCLGVLHYEGGRFNDARTRFADFLAQYGESPLRDAAQLCLGCCQVHLNQCAEAVQSLQALTEKKNTLAGQALLWLGKAQAGQANPADPEAFQQTLTEAQASLRRAADAYRAVADLDAKARRGEALLELAEVHQLAGQDKEAAVLIGQVLAERLLPRREEELLQRRLSVLTRAGNYQESDILCAQFQKTYPQSTLLPEVLFRYAENAQLHLAAAGKDAEAPRLNEETARRYQAVLERFPDFAHVNLARHGLALTYYRKGDYDKTREVLETIPGPDRSGDLAVVSYLLAECLLRLAPTQADDALAAGRLEEQLKTAAELLTSYVNEPPEPPLAADALLRLGFCQQRLSALMAKDEEKTKLRNAARATYERLLIDFPLHELQAHAALERAKTFALAGEVDPALRHLRRFTIEPLKRSAVAPLAYLQLATLLRGQENKAVEAVRLLAQCRQAYESALQKDPARAGWVPLVQYHHAVALKDAGRQPEARAILERIMKEYPGLPLTAEASLRWAQCLNEEGWPKIESARERLGVQGLSPEETAEANKTLAEGTKMVRDAARHLETQAERLRHQEQTGEIPAIMLHEAAWMHRGLGDVEMAAARKKLQEALVKKLQEEAARKTPEGQPVPPVASPEVPLAQVPLQPAEKQTRDVYHRLIETFPDLPRIHDARLELGELHAERGETAEAIKVFSEALDKEPPPAVTDKVRIRLGACHLARGDSKAALRQFEAVARTPDSALAGQGHLRAAECLMSSGRWSEALPHLVSFRDQEAFQNVGGVSDRALLQLGHVLGRLGKWDESRKAYEQVPARFGDSPWIDEARYGIGWTWLRQGQARKVLEGLPAPSADKITETAARTQILIDVCRIEQKQYAEAAAALEAVPGKYAFAELSALALVEAAHAHTQLKQREQAEKLLQQVVRDYPGAACTALARERLKAEKTEVPHSLPAGLRLLTPELTQPFPLEILGQQQANQTSLDDPTTEESLAIALNRTPSDRPAPAPLLRLTVPDPFEHRDTVRHLIPPEDDRLPLHAGPRPPRS